MRKVLISALVTLVLILGGVWVYLLFFGAPEGLDDIRGNIFGEVPDASAPTFPESGSGEPIEVFDTGRSIPINALLTKATERDVAGAVIASTSAGDVLRYIEKGTGHIYDISLVSGAEVRISNTTMPGVVRATLSPGGSYAAIMTEVGGGNRGDTLLLKIERDATGEVLLTTEVIDPIENIAFSNDETTLYYTEAEGSGTRGYARDLMTGGVVEEFRLPFKESTILWDTWEGRGHAVYTKPALGFMGYLYQIEGEDLVRVDAGAVLTAGRIGTSTFLVTTTGGTGPSSVLRTEGGGSVTLPMRALGEKCAMSTAFVWCGASSAISQGYPIDWYQGVVAHSDALWFVDPKLGQGSAVLDPEVATREAIDVVDAQATERWMIFKNKRDDSLWLFNPGIAQ